MKADSPVIRIGAWRVDPAADEISRDGNTVKLERRAMQLLMCLAEHAGQVVSVEQLLDEVWTGVVVTPDSVYHAVASLRRELGDDTREPAYIANVPRRGYRLVAPVRPWAEAPSATPRATPEPTLNPAQGPPPADRAAARADPLGRRTAIGLAIILLAALGYVIADRLWLSKRSAAPAPVSAATTPVSNNSIAVLPFVDMSEKRDQEYFADGMAEEILNLLETIPELRVIGRTSSFQFKGKTDDLRKIGAALGAAYIVEGSVRRSGDQLRVTAQLIDARDGSRRWSEAYDRNVGDVLKVQAEIATSLVRALQLEVTAAIHLESQASPRNAEAYDFYLRGLHANDHNDQQHNEEAIADFRHALQLDPTFVPAAAELALGLNFLASMKYVPTRTGFEDARAAAEAALRLDSRSAIAHVVLADVHLRYDWDWAAAAREVAAAVAFAPNDADVLDEAAEERMMVGQWSEAMRFLDAGITADPFNMSLLDDLFYVYLAEGRPAEAESVVRRILVIFPKSVGWRFWLGYVLLERGEAEAAKEQMQQETHAVGQTEGLALVYPALGRTQEANSFLARLVAEHANDSALDIAEAYAYRGQKDEAFHWLDRAYEQRDAELCLIKVDALLKPLRGDPRYQAFLRKMNLPE